MIRKMRDYSVDYEQILDELTSMGYDELVEQIKRRPPKRTQRGIDLIALSDSLIDAQKETGTFGVAYHTLISVMGQGAKDRERLANLRQVLTTQGNEARRNWFNQVRR
tara:strand:- start:1465 stop:1788 length:324 start_codon:yes stop_codon:yes gene_type:complete